MVRLLRISLFVCALSIFNSFVICRDEKVLSRKRRYLTFPEESTLQLVYDQIIGIVDYTNLFILGITCAMAWQLPHEPFDENFLSGQMDDSKDDSKDESMDTSMNSSMNASMNASMDASKDSEPKRRIDENFSDALLNGYVDRNYNSLDSSSWNEIFQKNNAPPWDDSTRKKFSSENNVDLKKPKKKHLAYVAIGKRSIPPTNKFDRFYMNHHRTTRHVVYKKIEKFLNARGVHGSDCLRKTLCETRQKQNDEQPASFVGEIMKVIFSLPVPNEDTVYSSLSERDYDAANNANVNCAEIYSKCNVSLWTSEFV